jgi:hypothetical protein
MGLYVSRYEGTIELSYRRSLLREIILTSSRILAAVILSIIKNMTIIVKSNLVIDHSPINI